MPSPARQLANTTNARQSTGPQTTAGKARSSQNARKHGLTAAQQVIAREDRREFEQLHADLQTSIHPKGALQQVLFEEIVNAAWNLRRIRAMEAELTQQADTYTDLLNDDALTIKLDRLARHKTRIERTFHRSLRELKALQTDDALALTLPSAFIGLVPPLANKTQIAKRTQSLVTEGRQTGFGKLYRGDDAEITAMEFVVDNAMQDAAAAG